MTIEKMRERAAMLEAVAAKMIKLAETKGGRHAFRARIASATSAVREARALRASIKARGER